ncbi:MAG: UDP-N-acetylglucosamine 2-epimerase (non-hydrolyzing) [Acidobacteria bacterium]|nr:UDP-N-acetylglucosamine 2-epimerase (non-hydrolyzing) [Acidobacteriota bacterium]
MKVAPLIREMRRRPEQFDAELVHTGQHYDDKMSQVFFDELEIPRPTVNLHAGSGSHAKQTAEVMLRLEPFVLEHRPDWVVVYGDVNSTAAAALVCSKLGIRLAHVEAGLRSFDRTMPEEINRLVTDQLADLLLTPSPEANDNLRREGCDPAKIHFVGNIMIDTLVHLLPKADQRWPALREQTGERYVLATFHRVSNVDKPETLTGIMTALARIAERVPVVFPVHPRTQNALRGLGIAGTERVRMIDPLGYLDFVALQKHAAAVVTDSGGVQEETTYLGVPCLTARPNTERPVTITEGTNRLVASDAESIASAVEETLENFQSSNRRPALWDGSTAVRIADLMSVLGR